MNAAFLLVSTALIVGQPGDKKPAAPAPAPVVASSCGSSCDTCCESFGHKLRGRLRGMFNRGCDTCDTCKPTTCHEHKTHCAPACAPACDTGCKKTWFHKEHACHATCAPAPTCCDPCSGPGFLTKFREKFHRHDSCCDGGCGSSSSCGTAAPPVKSGEKIEAPKKMPEAPKTPAKTQEVRIENQPAPNTIQVAPAAPIVEVTPVPAPRVEGARRDPF